MKINKILLLGYTGMLGTYLYIDSILPADQKIRLRAEAVAKNSSKKSKKGKKK
jgi:hypothetical protein